MNSKQIKATINRYKRSMEKEWKEHHFIRDGAGKRYLIGPLYLRINDTNGAFEHYEWFQKNFDDDMGEPFHRMAWALTYYRRGLEHSAEHMLRIAMLKNLYLFPILFGEDPNELDVSLSSNRAELAYILEAPEWYFDLWSAKELEWAIKVYDSPFAQKIRDRFITIHEFLELERPGEKRSLLVEELIKLEMGDFRALEK